MGINPDSYAPAAVPSSTDGGGASSSSTAFPATRHITPWENARLEAEARLSRESLPFFSAASALASHNSESTHPKPEPDFFIRIWNSEVSDAFQKPVSASRESAPSTGSSPESASMKQSGAVTVPEVAVVKENPSMER
ncbi:transcription factor MYB17-like [Elaeis guineensis]|uniref:transcription factor MYB17-like n=1 Tax=Elaeis guineensis var. tenera TaxID=51953 RepID=UPI00094FD8A5